MNILEMLLSKICKKCAFRANSYFSTRVSGKDLKKYSHTIFLPSTKFPQRIHPGRRALMDDNIIENYGFDELYNNQRSANKKEEYILHDGPPYANGVPHMGHAINKVLKDIINRWHLLDGRKIHYVPGWDCHGLPIELKALAAGVSSNLPALDIRKKAKEFAERTIAEQKVVFRSWGVMADWNGHGGCYRTFDQSYVANQLEQFYLLYQKGLVYRKLKPVYWSPVARTALAESELEYNSKHKSTAITLRLQIQNPPGDWGADGNVYALIWTTTPWTLPANQAIAYNPEMGYSLVQDGHGDRYVVASALISSLTWLNGQVEPVLHFEGDQLKSLKYRHPLTGSLLSFYPGSHVTADAGTGLVHTAPAHGHDDFLIGISHNLPLDCIVDEEGAYTSKAGLGLKGLHVLREGNQKIMELLSDDIVHQENIVHSYPYDWRSKQPVIIRSSLQWFIDTESIKDTAIESLKKVNILPSRNVDVLLKQIEQRPYWCISRQRAWGVPIPVLYNNEKPIVNRDLIEHYKGLITSKGPDFWWAVPIQELIPEKLQSSMPTNLRKSEDIMDIWLDSGLSWSSVLGSKTADLYLEGVDQFTGWFQSSLLTSIALRGKPPFKKIVAHGFAVDENGKKMSKSLGNVINPQDITRGGFDLKKDPPYGVDVLRWWVASHGLQRSTTTTSKRLLDDCAENIKRLRNTLKFLIGSISDFPEGLVIEPPILSTLDKYFLLQLQDFQAKIDQSYKSFHLNQVCSFINNFVANDLSSFYCHITKDRLYCDGSRSKRRKSTQYALFHALNILSKSFAPIMPILAEELYSYHPHRTDESKPYFYEFDKIPSIQLKLESQEIRQLKSCFGLVLNLKKELTDEIPVNLKSSQVGLVIRADSSSYELLQLLQEEEESFYSDLVAILQVSYVVLQKDESASTCSLDVRVADYELCSRCRKCCVPRMADNDVCSRCEDVIDVCPTVDVSSV